MSANASPASLDAYLSDLTKDHSSVTTVSIRGLTGAKLKRQLQARLDRLTERASTLPETIHWQLVGLNWLDENQHIIREAIVQVGGSLPAGFLRKLPAFRTASGTIELRVKSLAEAIVEYCALPLDIASIERFLSAYQAEVPLTLGELWALPTLLRVVVIGVLCDSLDEGLDLASRGARKTRETEIAGTLSGAILSLRTIAAIGWRQFVERQSVVESILKGDATGDYPSMDPDSRNRYRERVERLARSLKVPEPTLAETAVRLGAAAPEAATRRERHVGHYLVGDGLALLEKSVRGRPLLRERIGLRAHSAKSWGYLLAVGVPTLSSLIVLARFFASLSSGALGGWILLVLTVVPVLTIWTEIVNWLTTQFLKPRALPKLDFAEGIPVNHATIVGVPCMLTTIADIDVLVHSLEISYLGNEDPQLWFTLLSDYVDADHAERETDRELLDYARAGIDALNLRYGDTLRQPFALLHRRRLWNQRAARWMGWERKRGKIDELNRWLLGADDTSISVIHGGNKTLRDARYVITLDADNQLLPGTAAQLIGALAHPLNRPRFDDRTQRVVGGYTVIQPRVDLHPASTNRTLFSRLMSGDAGIDLYHSATSETYQDLFGQGIYAGKGIYDVRAFSRSVEGRVPANAVLSHDLLEGILGRAALASDIVVLENASPNLSAELKRQHRWVRGDWQLLPWLIPIRSSAKQRRDIDLLGRWKLFDNLRRSLLPASLLALYFVGWILIPEYGAAWTFAVALTPALGIVYSLLGEVRHSALRWGTLRSTVLRLTSNFGKLVAQWLVNLAVLPIVTSTILDAVARTLARVTVTRRNLLQWTPAAETELTAVGADLIATYRRAVVAPAAGLAAISVAILNEPFNVLAAVLGVVWCAAPLLIWFMGRERGEPEQLHLAGTTELRLLARRTWQFYERFVGPETHWLPPDNYQEAPKLSVAERTSPTNIGLFLLASIAAYDLHYIGASGLLARIDGTTATLLRMKKFRGHLFNWYNTRDLSVLAPDYVSTVDSGNLLAALLVCRTALESIGTTPLAHLRARASLNDIVLNIADVLGLTDSRDGKLGTESVAEALSTIRKRLAQTPDNVDAWAATVAEIRDKLCAQLDAAVLSLAEQRDPTWDASEIEALRTWVIQLRYEAESLRGEIANVLACWSAVEARAHALGQKLPAPRTLGEIIELVDTAAAGRTDVDEMQRSTKGLREVLSHRDRAIRRIDSIVAETDFGFLFDATRKLFHIGYNNTTGELDASYYDLLASEARIASLIAIAKGDVPVSHWVHLGRPLRRLGGMRVALSWSATAFEYLMPRLFMVSPPQGLMDASCRAVIREQRKLTRRSDAPWGVSESAYFDLDATGHYKYFAFGVDSLALRRSTRKRYVVTPYASILALPFEPAKVIDNLRRFRKFGCWGRYGLYEALDFGEDHSAKSKPRIVQTFMAHHQAMILAAIANVLHGDSLVRRFHANPAIRAVEHLLYEALPKRAQDRIVRYMPPARSRVVPVMTAEHVPISTNGAKRFVNVVGNGHLTARTSGRGGGDLTWNGRAVTRWQPRTMGPDGGDRIYLSESDTGDIHILGISDTEGQPAADVWCAPYQTEIHQRFGTLFARLTVGVAPDNDVAFKRVTLTNESSHRRTIKLTHYAEIVLASAAEDQRHPAFNKLFIESQYVRESSVLLFSRRPRSSDEAGLCCAVGVVAAPEFKPTIQVETDRRAFLGRANGYRRPAALSTDSVADVEGDAGLDPVAAFSVTLDLPPGETSQVVFLAAVSSDKSQALELVAHFRSFERVAFGFDQARRRATAELTDLAIDSGEVARLLVIYADMLWPGPLTAQALAKMDLRESILGALWARGISGDFPICMACSRRRSDSDEAERLLILQAYLGSRGVPIDVVLVDESTSSYAEPVRNVLEELVEKYRRPHRQAHAFILSANSLSATERAAIDAAALVRLRSDGDESERQRDRRFVPHRDLPDFVPTLSPVNNETTESGLFESPDLEFNNGYGGIDARDGDYIIRVRATEPTPAPWINVLANSRFGSIVSERGAATTWYGNSSEHRLTPWYNDAVCDRSGEAIYARDEETGEFWSPMPWPVPGRRDYLVRHGAGFSAFDHVSHQLRQRAECFVDKEHPAKCISIRLHNTAGRPRRITLTYYVEWVLGNHYEDNGPFIFPGISHEHNALLARNALPRSGAERVAFVTSTAPLHGYTTDRREFLGVARDPGRPAALRRLGLSGKIVAAAEPCCAFQIHVNLAVDEATEICFTIGAGDNRESALDLAAKFGDSEFVDARRVTTKRYWKDLLNRCRIRTPNHALDVMFNRWLLYQNLACRLWGRSGFYQAAGGFGFRDQLQDSLALLHVWPDLTREQIIRACSVQFSEGDVLHWWHDTPTRGVRTKCSDDLLWLPYAVSEYLRITNDTTILDEKVAFLDGEPLRADEGDRYAEFSPGQLVATVYEHCNRAIDARATTGEHGLPLIGTGDWNDGLNRVGIAGRGESAWLGWFLADVCHRFAELAATRNESTRSAALAKQRDALIESLERHAWNGDWYLRAYYDDGSTLGAAGDTECQIDLNAQTWPVITGFAKPERANRAFDAAAERLIDTDARLIKLLAPPFSRTLKDPGYIKGYPPGVRENGGQYTHASTWAVWAAAKLNRADQAMSLMDLLNPLLRATNKTDADRYRGEPYVLSGDIYAVAPRVGQAGWTWYTGSAAWAYRIVLEQILGVQPVQGKLMIRPCVPRSWPSFEIDYSVGDTMYRIKVLDPAGIAESDVKFELDDQPVEAVELLDDGGDHRVVASPSRAKDVNSAI